MTYSETDKPNCYLLFIIPIKNGLMELRGVFTEQLYAARARKMLLRQDEFQGLILKSWIEVRMMNHVYGSSMLDMVDTEVFNKLINKGIDITTNPQSVEGE
jgi:hypothetical protein